MASSYYYSGCEADESYQQPHFLDSCSLCSRPLISDIFMYRGNTPYCSADCRQEQIEVDDITENKRRQLSSSLDMMRPNSHVIRPNKVSSKEYDTNKAVRTGTFAVA